MAVDFESRNGDVQAYRMKNTDEYDNRRNFEDTVPRDSPLVDDHSSYYHLDTEAIDSDCHGHWKNGSAFECEQEEVVLDSEDEEINGSRLVVVTKSALESLVEKRAKTESLEKKNSNASLDKHHDTGNEKNRPKFDDETVSFNGDISIQEHEEWSQVEALDFVDHLVSINNAELSPKIGYRNTLRKRSPMVVSENGPRKLARKINMNNPVKGNGNFDWFELEEKESPRQEIKLASDLNQETRVTNAEDAFDVYDVGFDTQIAAEAIEALAYAHPLDACPIIEEKDDNLSTRFEEHNPQLNHTSFRTSVSDKQKKRSERKFGRCNLSSPKKQCGNNELKKPIEQFKWKSAKVSPLVNTNEDCRTEKMFGDTQRSIMVYTRKRSRKNAKSLRVSTTNAIDDSRTGKMFGNTQRSIIVYRRKRSRANAKPLRVSTVRDSSKLCDSSEDSRENSSTCLMKSGMWNYPRGKRTKRRARNDSHRTFDLNQTVFRTDVVAAEKKISSECATLNNKRRQQCANIPKTPLLKELLNLGFSEHRPEFESKELRRRKDIASARILFSQHLDEDIVKHQKKVAARLGVSVVSCCKDATHFIADKFARTKNMLEAIALGKPVVTHVWLENCGEAKCYIDEKNYILRDFKKEKEFGFSMPVSLTRASQHPLLKDQRIFITPNIKPNRTMIMNLVNAVQGELVEKVETHKDLSEEDLLILSCEEDYSICVPFLQNGLAVHSSELLLNGIITQKMEYKRFQLFSIVNRNRSETGET